MEVLLPNSWQNFIKPFIELFSGKLLCVFKFLLIEEALVFRLIQLKSQVATKPTSIGHQIFVNLHAHQISFSYKLS